MFLFVIQSKNNIPLFDFGFTMIKSIEYHKDFKENHYEYVLVETYQEFLLKMEEAGEKWDYKKVIPVGSLEFTAFFLDNKEMRAINIPPELMDKKFTGREVSVVKKKDLTINKPTFVKEFKYKGLTDILFRTEDIPSRIEESADLLISEVVDFVSEYRVFVFEERILDMKHYLGDPFTVPSEKKIYEMIYAFGRNTLSSYTLDVAVTSEGETVIVEIHPFVSVGLYGYADYKYLPPMFIRGFSFLNK